MDWQKGAELGERPDGHEDSGQEVYPAELANLACMAALTHRNVLQLIFPDEVQALEAAGDAKTGAPTGPMSSHSTLPDATAMTALKAQIESARQPMIIVGFGARDAMDGIIHFAEMTSTPIATTFKDKR